MLTQHAFLFRSLCAAALASSVSIAAAQLPPGGIPVSADGKVRIDEDGIYVVDDATADPANDNVAPSDTAAGTKSLPAVTPKASTPAPSAAPPRVTPSGSATSRNRSTQSRTRSSHSNHRRSYCYNRSQTNTNTGGNVSIHTQAATSGFSAIKVAPIPKPATTTAATSTRPTITPSRAYTNRRTYSRTNTRTGSRRRITFRRRTFGGTNTRSNTQTHTRITAGDDGGT